MTTTDGTGVTISFGVDSDGITSNQKIAPGIIDALKYALNKANVGYTSKITEIFISTTNNGRHSEDSNHFRNKAIDISRINGTKISLMTDMTLVNRLQDAFELYHDIRENFGPNFTHKNLAHHTVSDHSNHIHVSTNNCD